MVSGQRFHAGQECWSHSDRATCRLKRPIPRRAHAQRQTLGTWQGGLPRTSTRRRCAPRLCPWRPDSDSEPLC
eukprot:1399142-Prymnesium_polylepis.1